MNKNIFEVNKDELAYKHRLLSLTPILVGIDDNFVAAIGHHRVIRDSIKQLNCIQYAYLNKERCCDVIAVVGILFKIPTEGKQLRLKSIIIEEVIISESTNQKWFCNTQIIDSESVINYLEEGKWKDAIPLHRSELCTHNKQYENNILEYFINGKKHTSSHFYKEDSVISKYIADNIIDNSSLEREMCVKLRSAKLNYESRIKSSEIAATSRIESAEIVSNAILDVARATDRAGIRGAKAISDPKGYHAKGAF
jgi:hypothetical protein